MAAPKDASAFKHPRMELVAAAKSGSAEALDGPLALFIRCHCPRNGGDPFCDHGVKAWRAAVQASCAPGRAKALSRLLESAPAGQREWLDSILHESLRNRDIPEQSAALVAHGARIPWSRSGFRGYGNSPSTPSYFDKALAALESSGNADEIRRSIDAARAVSEKTSPWTRSTSSDELERRRALLEELDLRLSLQPAKGGSTPRL